MLPDTPLWISPVQVRYLDYALSHVKHNLEQRFAPLNINFANSPTSSRLFTSFFLPDPARHQ